jgi:hypothetical protein
MEPWTWIVQASWMLIGSAFFAAKRTDFDEKSLFDYQYKIKLD